MTPERRLHWAQVLLFITPAMWSLNYIVARASAGVVHPHLLALLRWSIALLIMLPFAWPALRKAWPHWRHEWRDALLLGALGMWICGAWVYQGGQTTSATNIGLLYAVSPVLIAAASGILFKEHLNAAQKLGVALALAGTLAVVLKGDPGALLRLQFVVGDAWIVAAVMSWTTYSLLLRKRSSVLDPFARLTVITIGGVLVLIPFTLLEVVLAGPPVWSTKLWILAIVAAVFPGFASYQAYSFMQRELGIAKTGLVLYLGPLYAAGVAWWLLGEPVRWYHLLGAALILPGIYLATRAKSSAIPSPRLESR
jgi:drug/metabolite transporter (DMT)-like permease